jgi:hypothetical protein
MTTISDDFTRADSAVIGGSWTNGLGEWGNGLGIASNKANGNASYAGAAIHATALASNDCYVEADWIEPGTTDMWRMAICLESSAWDTSTPGIPTTNASVGAGYHIHKYRWASTLSLSEQGSVLATGTPAVGTTYKLENNGGSLDVLVDAVSAITYTDVSPITSGTATYVGISAKVGQFDNFIAEDLGGAPAWAGSFVRIAAGTLARVRDSAGSAASVRLSNGTRL